MELKVADGIDYQYSLGEFSDDLFEVTKNGYKGFIDKKGNEVIPCIYSKVTPFYKGLSVVERKVDSWPLNEVINKKGKVVVSSYKDDFKILPNGFILVKNFIGQLGLKNRRGKNVLSCICSKFADANESILAYKKAHVNIWGFVKSNGERLGECYSAVTPFSEGLAAVSDYSNSWGFINPNGEKIIPYKYKMARGFHEQLAAVQYYNGLWGFIDKNGKYIIPLIYSEVGDFHEGFAKVYSNGYWYFIDKIGIHQFGKSFRSLHSFQNGFAIFGQARGVLGVIDTTGKEIIKGKYESIVDNKNGTFTTKEKESYCLYNSRGELIVSDYSYIGFFHEDYAIVNKKNRFGYINSSGQEVIPCQYYTSAEAKDRLAEVLHENSIQKKMTANGKETLAYPIGEGYSYIKNDDYTVDVNRNGKRIFSLSPVYTSLIELANQSVFISDTDQKRFYQKKQALLEQIRQMYPTNSSKILEEQADVEEDILTLTFKKEEK